MFFLQPVKITAITSDKLLILFILQITVPSSGTSLDIQAIIASTDVPSLSCGGWGVCVFGAGLSFPVSSVQCLF